jgi:hypothetical protein
MLMGSSLFAALRPLEMIDPAHVRYDVSTESGSSKRADEQMVDGWIRDVKFLRLAASHVVSPLL